MDAQPLTPRQAKILAFIVDRIRTDGRPPTVREIMAHFGIKSPNAVSGHLKMLERKGHIVRTFGVSRGIRLVRGNGACPLCGSRAGHSVAALN